MTRRHQPEERRSGGGGSRGGRGSGRVWGPPSVRPEEDLGGQTRIGMVKPTAMLAGHSESQELKRLADEVEMAITRMINDAR